MVHVDVQYRISDFCHRCTTSILELSEFSVGTFADAFIFHSILGGSAGSKGRRAFAAVSARAHLGRSGSCGRRRRECTCIDQKGEVTTVLLCGYQRLQLQAQPWNPISLHSDTIITLFILPFCLEGGSAASAASQRIGPRRSVGGNFRGKSPRRATGFP